MMKIAIIGYSGAGKSTLAQHLGTMYQLPITHLDKFHFIENWQERDRDEVSKLVKEVLLQDQWVIDGNYSKFSYEERMVDADQIIYLNFPRRICLYRALKRNIEYRNQVRDSIAEGCIEKFDLEFLLWILYKGRLKEIKQRHRDLKKQYPNKVIEIKSPKELERYLNRIKDMK